MTKPKTERKMKERTNARLLNHSAPRSCNTAPEQANAVQGRLGVNSHDGDICDYRVLREGGRAHLVEQLSITQ